VAPASWVSAVIMLATLVPFVLGLVLAGALPRGGRGRSMRR
jgi:ATP-binding cassette subfamily C protein CydD